MPTSFNWNNYEEVKPGQKFNWDDHPVVGAPEAGLLPGQEPVPVAASAATGFWGSIPFSRQIAAAGKTGMDVLTGITQPSDALDEYRDTRDSLGQDFKIAQSAHPVAAFGGAMAGGMAVGRALPGADAIEKGAVYGGLEGLSNSNADLTRGEIGSATDDTLRGLALGGMTAGAMEGGISLLKTGKEHLYSAARKLARMSHDEAQAFVENPEEVRQMATQLENGGQPALQDQASAAIQKSREILKQQGLTRAKELAAKLEGKNVTINPEELRGYHPEVDRILDQARARQVQAGMQTSTPMPDEAPIPGAEPSELDEFRKPAGVQPELPVSRRVSGAQANRLPDIPKERRLTPIQEFAQDAGMDASPRIPVRPKTPSPPPTSADLAEFGKVAGLEPELPASSPAPGAEPGPIDPESAQAFKALFNPPTPAQEIPANDLNRIKRILQDLAKYKQGTVLDPIQAARNEEAGALASKARKAIENVGGDEVANMNADMQTGMNLQTELRKGLKSPLAFTTTGSADRLANIARAEQRGAGGILDFGNKFGAAKSMVTKDVDDAGIRMAEKWAGRTALTVGHGLSQIVEKTPQMLGRFAPILQQAASRGPTSLAATHFILQQTEPEYRQKLNELQGEGQKQ